MTRKYLDLAKAGTWLLLGVSLMVGAAATAMAAGQKTTYTKTYNFTEGDPNVAADKCCSAWMNYTNLDPKGMELDGGKIVLGIEDKSFFHFAKNGEAFTKLSTSVDSKFEGYLDIYYVFSCDKDKNKECPLGNVTVPFSMEISCGKKAKADYEYIYSWADLGVKLARMITSRPNPEVPLTGKAVVVLTDMQPCQ